MSREGGLSLWGAAVVVALLASTVTMIVSAARTANPKSGVTTVHARYVRSPDFHALVHRSDFIARGKVTSVSAGPRLVFDDPDHPTTMPTEIVTFEQVETLDGRAPEVFSIMRTGSGKVQIEHEPRYAVGTTHVMALRGSEGPEQLYVPVGGPDGRYEVSAGGKLRGVTDTGVSREVHGRSLGELRRMIRDARN